MNILFLNIDGVLSSVSTALTVQTGKGHRDYAYSTTSVGLLRRLCDECNLKIVLVGKRKHFATDNDCILYYKKLFSETYGWDNFPVIGRTPHLGKIVNKLTKCSETRGYEIEAWIKQNPNLCLNWAVVDCDNVYRSSQKLRVVTVSPALGFTFIEYVKLRQNYGLIDADYALLVSQAKALYSIL